MENNSNENTNIEIINSKDFNYFKRNKYFLLLFFPFFIISFIITGIHIYCENSLDNYSLSEYALPLARIIFSSIYTIFMHNLFHKTNGLFSNEKFQQKKKYKTINSILLLLPIISILICSIHNSLGILSWIRNGFLSLNNIGIIDLIIAFNALLFNLSLVYMYFKNNLNLPQNGIIIKDNGKKIIKNKRLISLSYIFKFSLLILLISLLSNFLSNEFVNIFSRTISEDDISSMYEIMIINSNSYKLYYISYTIIFNALFFFGISIVHKYISKKVCIEKQNKGFIKRSVNIIISLIIILQSFLILTPQINIEIMTDILEPYNLYLDIKDLIDIDFFSNGESLEKSIDFFGKDFNIDKIMNSYHSSENISIICFSINLVFLIIFIIKNNSNINKLAVDNTLDENNNIVPTQSRTNKEYKKIIAFFLILNALLIAILFFITQTNDTDYTYGKHIEFKKLPYYNEYTINVVEDSNEEENSSYESLNASGESIISGDKNEEVLNWSKLEYEDDWYLNNEITIADYKKYLFNHDDYKVDKEYLLSKIEDAIELKQKLLNYKNLYDAENELNIKFIHTSVGEWTYVLDNKNLLTRAGVTVFVDNFTDRNILVTNLFGELKEYEKEYRSNLLELNIDDINERLPILYGDMTSTELISILGNNYYYEKDSFNLNDETFIWYDKLGNSLKVIFRDNVIRKICLEKKS